MTILQNLRFVALPKATTTDPIQQRRARFIAQLEQQRELAKDTGYVAQRSKWVTQPDGTRQLIAVPKRVKRWWRVDVAGNYFLVLRYGNRIISIEAGRSAIAVGDRTQLVPVLSKVIAATQAGEMDALLAATRPSPKPTKRRRTAGGKR